MELEVFISRFLNGNKSRFARCSYITPQRVSQLCKFGGRVSKATEEKIKIASGGKVTAYDLLLKAEEIEELDNDA